MSRKFAIRQSFQAAPSTSTAKAVANATPVSHAFAQVIMDKYSPDVEADEHNDIQALFDKWPNDVTTQRLAELTEVLTGYKPTVDNSAQIGSLFKLNGKIYATFNVQGGYAYGVSANGKSNTISSFYLPGSNKANGVTRSEAGLFAKELLSAAGSDLLASVATYGAPAVTTFLKAIGSDVV
jgi:hypothetical protein